MGSALCRALAAAGARVEGTLRPGGSRWRVPSLPPGMRLHEVDLTRGDAVRRLMDAARPELVFCAAAHNAYAYEAPLAELVGREILPVASLLDAAAARPLARFVLLGTSLEYGPSAAPHREDDPLRPATVRGALKAGAGLLALERARSGAVPLVHLRLFHVYGPWEPLHRLVPRAIRAALSGETLPLVRPGIRRDLVFVEDVADACLAAATAPGMVGEVINVGGGRERTVEEIVTAVGEALGLPVRVEPGAFPPRPADCEHWQAEPAKARRLLGWEPRTPLAEGVLKTAAWMRGQGEEAWKARGPEGGSARERGDGA